jgi:hypothetical protein
MGFSLWVLVLAMTKPRWLKPALLAPAPILPSSMTAIFKAASIAIPLGTAKRFSSFRMPHCKT